jgi:ribulose-bisphosphate carboxylase large chain
MRNDYVDLKYKPKKNEICCMYYMEPAKGVSMEEAATHLAGESSIDTWTDILTLSPAIAKKLKPHVYFIDKRKKVIKVAYNIELFERGSVPQLLSAIAGNIYGMRILDNLRLIDFLFPSEYISSFDGPLYGIKGIRDIFEIKGRPLLGTIVKPKVGLNSKEHARIAYEAWSGGIDIVKDDENLTSQSFNTFEERASLTLKMRKRAEQKTGEKKGYMANITAGTVDEMVRRAKLVKNLGGRYAMVDILTLGWTGLQSLREANKGLKLILHAHRAMHAALTRNPKHGMSMLSIAKLSRLIGVDQVHIGTAIGKMEGGKKEILEIRDEIAMASLARLPESESYFHEQRWYHIKPVFPVASGGLEPTMLPDLLKIFGNDCIFQFGGGLHAHPMGTNAGAKAARQALDASLKEIPLKKHAEKHPELKAALDKWRS